jgi:prepilin-type N-terminal cleavage/methylation domain-containing protein
METLSQGRAVGLHARRAFTLVEMLVVISIIALLISLLLPAIATARDKAQISQSVANLRNLAAANEAYAGDWNDRQFTAVPDDAGLTGGNITAYATQIACPPQQMLGWGRPLASSPDAIQDGQVDRMWGYFLGGIGKCANRYPMPQAPGNWIVYLPIKFGSSGSGGAGYGAFRVPNVRAFHNYVGGKFYDKTFYAPKDRQALAQVDKYFMDAAEFAYDGQRYEDSSYCFSPAAMWDPKVLGRNQSELNGNGYTNPSTLPAGFRSPAVSRCKYPSLKTRMIEHNWLQNTPASPYNANFAGNSTPWYFNHGYNSAPASLFFDGHVELVGCQRAMQAEDRAGKLWSRNTPFGQSGYFGGQFAYDFLVDTSFHMLTTDGIEGRDVLGAEG